MIHLAGIARTAPIRMLVYFLVIAGLAVCATLLTNLLVPAAPSPWHQLVIIKNLCLPWVTGGDFGPEGSFVLLGLTLLMSAIFAILTIRKNHWEPSRLSLAHR